MQNLKWATAHLSRRLGAECARHAGWARRRGDQAGRVGAGRALVRGRCDIARGAQAGSLADAQGRAAGALGAHGTGARGARH